MQYPNSSNYNSSEETYQVTVYGKVLTLIKRNGKFIKPTELKEIEGTGSALKPAHETWWLCRKPIAEDSIAANVLEYGTGALNIDATRIGNETIETHIQPIYKYSGENSRPYHEHLVKETMQHSGRWPSNLLLSHTLLCSEEDGCAEDCPVAEMDRQSGVSKSSISSIKRPDIRGNNYNRSSGIYDVVSCVNNDQGGASRYFQRFYYAAKTSKRERNAGCEELEASRSEYRTNDPTENSLRTRLHGSVASKNNHPTVKPIALLRYFVKLICPPDGVVLDCFGGSGSTALACIAENKRYILIERESDYCAIAQARIDHALRQQKD